MQGTINQSQTNEQTAPVVTPEKRGFPWFKQWGKKPATREQSSAPVQEKNQVKEKKSRVHKPMVYPIMLPTVQPFTRKAGKTVTAVANNLYTWQWTKAVFYWLVLSAGTASDLVFLMASIWMSVNANVHGLILRYMSEDQATYMTYLSTTAYVALPIFIVGLAVVQAVGHIKMWKIGGFWPVFWSVIFGIPALIFLVMDVVTISCSVASITFTMPTFFVVVRADSAFIFAFGSLIYFFLGKPQERERLAEKDAKIEELQGRMEQSLAALAGEKDQMISALLEEKASILVNTAQEKASILANTAQEKESLVSTIGAKNDEIESLKGLLVETQRGFSELHRAVSRSEESALEGYGPDCIAWLKSGVKSANVETITRFTGLGTAKVNNAIKRGELKTTPNNKGLILFSSLLPWLKSLEGERRTDVDIPALHLVNS